jgi:glycosyltransferase involved in cell wall biosynthesis
MPFNICCFTRITFSHAIKGGMELHTRVLSEELVNRGHQVTILTTSLQPMKEIIQNENSVALHYLPVAKPGTYSKEYFKLSAARFKELHHSKPFDVAWSESAGALGIVKYISKYDRIPLIIKFQGSIIGGVITSFRSAKNFKKATISFLRNLPIYLIRSITWRAPLIRNSGMVICPSPQTAKELRIETLMSQNKIYVSVNGVDVNLFKSDDKLRDKGRKAIDLRDDDYFILNVGRLSSDKGIDILIRAFAILLEEIPNLFLAIAGVGGELFKLKTLSDKLYIKNRIRFLGFIPNEQLPMYYNACDLFVCPTVRVESFGIVIAEAMACGRPVIASATGGTKYVVGNNENGILVPPKNVTALADAIRQIAKDDNLAKRIGNKARHRAVNYLSSRRMVKDTENVIRKIV